jgi:S1-C subfamily serine protease
MVSRTYWAENWALGPLKISRVPIDEEAHIFTVAVMPQHAARFGLYALRRLDFVVDGPGGSVYIRPSKNPPPEFSHNRLGAVFTPANLQSDPLLATVASGSPAYTAGIRDGDILLKIDNLDATKWRTDPQIMPLRRFLERPAGSSLQLTVRRGDREFEAVVVLRDILGPPARKKSLH